MWQVDLLVGTIGAAVLTGGGIAEWLRREPSEPPTVVPRSRPRCPVPDEQCEWIESRLSWLSVRLGPPDWGRRPVLRPDAALLPASFNGSWWHTQQLLIRMARTMGVNPWRVLLVVYDGTPHPAAAAPREDGFRVVGFALPNNRFSGVGIDRGWKPTPAQTAGVLAHELAHVRLNEVDGSVHKEPDLESLTDLTALYLGGGVLVANLAATAKKPAEYLGPAALGYALSWLARESGEHDPAWLADLEAAPRAAFRRGMAYLEAERSDGHAQ